MTTVTVLKSRLGEAKKELEKLARRAARASGDTITVEVGGERMEATYVTDWDGTERRVDRPVVDLNVEGEAPRIGPWVFQARIEYTTAGVIIDSRPGVEVSQKFRERGPHCDHCHTDRQRKDTYVVRHEETGEEIQVGRSCLRDHLGIDNPATVAARFRLERQLREESDTWSAAWAVQYPTQAALVAAATAIRLFGWCSKGMAMADESLTSTSEMVRLVLTEDVRSLPDWLKALRQQMIEAVSDTDRAMAQETLHYFREELQDGCGDYLANLRVILALDTFEPRRTSLVASAVSTYAKAKGLEVLSQWKTKVEGTSQFVGEVGQRLKGVEVTLEEVRSVGSGRYGDVILSKMRDPDGNLLIWFSGSSTGKHVGEEFMIDATVKKHDTFQEVAQTALTRVKVV